MSETEASKPPSTKAFIRQPTSVRIRSSSNDRSIARCREVALLRHLSCPDLRFRTRNDLVILASF